MNKLISGGLLNLAVASASWGLTPEEIIAKVEAKYAGLTSIAIDGTAVSEYNAPVDSNDGTTHTSVTNYKIRLARPALYRIEWNASKIRSAADVGAVWSSGGQHHLFLVGKVSERDDLEANLGAAAGVSSGATHTIPNLFFAQPTNLLRSIANATVLPDETVRDLDCYVISGDIRGQKLTVWITKDFLLIQNRHIHRGPITIPESSDEELRKNQERHQLSATPEDVARMRETIQRARKRAVNFKGTSTETVDSIELNPPLEKEIFETRNSALPSLPR